MHEEKSESSSFEGMQINVVKKEENLPRLKHFLSIKCKLSGQRRLVHFGIWKDMLFLVSLNATGCLLWSEDSVSGSYQGYSVFTKRVGRHWNN